MIIVKQICWLKNHTASGHIGKMEKEELLKLITEIAPPAKEPQSED
jgi:hypothetical protein